jgi:hypothetical protein
MDIQKIDYPKDAPRVETGAVQFGDDWPGTFIRGDNAAYYAFTLREVLSRLNADQEVRVKLGLTMEVLTLQGLLSDLEGSNVNNQPK